MQNYTLPKLVNCVLSSNNYFGYKSESSVYPEMELDLKSTSPAESEFPAIKELLKETTDEIYKEVISYVEGKTDFHFHHVNENTVFAYLAAAKIIDLTIPAEKQINSTIAIRDACLSEPNSFKNNKQITLLNAYIIPVLAESRIQFLNRFDEIKMREIRVEQENAVKTTTIFHRDTHSRIETVLKQALLAIIESTNRLKSNLFFAGVMGVGKSTQLTRFVNELYGTPTDLNSIVYGTDLMKTFLREQFSPCQSGPSFVLGMCLRHVLETAVKTGSAKDLFFLQEGVLSNNPVALNLLKNTKCLEIRDNDAPFKIIAMRALNREHQRMERKLEFDILSRSTVSCRNVRLKLIENLTESHTYTLNFNGKILSPEEVKQFDYNEPDLDAIGNEVITKEDISPFDADLTQYVGKTVLEAFTAIDNLF